MKFAIIDIDGVIATTGARNAEWKKYYGILDISARAKSGLPYLQNSLDYYPFSSNAIKEIYRLQRETGCKFVLCSSWSLGRTLPQCNELFLLKGLKLNFYDIIAPQYKKIEINDWLLKHKNDIDSFVIIDDECKTLSEDFPNNIVKPKPRYGFTAKHCNQAIKILNHESQN